MPNIGTVLKDEISRLARKELKAQTEGLRKASAQRRHDMAALKREVSQLQRQVALLQSQKPTPAASVADDTATSTRFTAKGLVSQRKRLGLSAAEYGQLIDVTPQSVYNWERGKTRPRKEQVARLAALRGIGKKEVQARLADVKPPAKVKAKPAKAKPAKAKPVKRKAPRAKAAKAKVSKRKRA